MSCPPQHRRRKRRPAEDSSSDSEDGNLDGPAIEREATRHGRPYLLCLGATNGTFLNDRRIPPLRFVELRVRDAIRLGESSREYVLLHEDM